MTKLKTITVEGSPLDMGQAFGEVCREDMQALLDIRIQGAICFAADRGKIIVADDVLAAAQGCLAATEAFDARDWQEFCGMAQGANFSHAQLYALHGLTDLRDVLTYFEPDGMGCSSFITMPDVTKDGRCYVGQTWDLQTSNMPFMRMVHRKPADAPQSLSLTLTGCFSLAGINELGVAVGTTNIVTTDARPGVNYLSLLHRSLRCQSAQAAADIIGQAQRAGSHFYYLADKASEAIALETSATRVHQTAVKQGIYVHCNHVLNNDIRELESAAPGPSSDFRQSRLTDVLNGQSQINVESLKAAMSDGEGGPLAVSRHDFDNISTNGCAIMCPESGEIHACYGPAELGEWEVFGF